jgi:heme/copper-type cytochrome/quinol oxidase subunit 1
MSLEAPIAQPSSITPSVIPEETERQVLERTWQDARGLFGWLSNAHHRAIGKRYIVTAFIFFLFGGILALLMRFQLARPESRFLGPDLYNQIFTMHGTTMMFLFAVPMMEGVRVYLVPLMVGTRNIAFPRLNAFSYYIFLFGGIMLYTAIVLSLIATGFIAFGLWVHHMFATDVP